MYSDNNLNKLDSGTDPWWFEADLRLVFEKFDANFDIERLLEGAGVIGPDDVPDSETCAFVCNFKTKEQGNRFIGRLNNFIESQ